MKKFYNKLIKKLTCIVLAIAIIIPSMPTIKSYAADYSQSATTAAVVLNNSTRYDINLNSFKENAISVYSAKSGLYKTSAFTQDSTSEVIVQIFGYDRTGIDVQKITGRVVAKSSDIVGTSIPVNGFVLSGNGSSKNIIESLELGDVVEYIPVAASPKDFHSYIADSTYDMSGVRLPLWIAEFEGVRVDFDTNNVTNTWDHPVGNFAIITDMNKYANTGTWARDIYLSEDNTILGVSNNGAAIWTPAQIADKSVKTILSFKISAQTPQPSKAVLDAFNALAATPNLESSGKKVKLYQANTLDVMSITSFNEDSEQKVNSTSVYDYSYNNNDHKVIVTNENSGITFINKQGMVTNSISGLQGNTTGTYDIPENGYVIVSHFNSEPNTRYFYHTFKIGDYFKIDTASMFIAPLTPLEALQSTYNAVNESGSKYTNGRYHADQLALLTGAKNEAKTALDNPVATDAEVSNSLVALKIAISKFDLSLLLTDAKIATVSDAYDAQAYENIKSAISSAELLESSFATATFDEISDGLNKLETVYNHLAADKSKITQPSFIYLNKVYLADGFNDIRAVVPKNKNNSFIIYDANYTGYDDNAVGQKSKKSATSVAATGVEVAVVDGVIVDHTLNRTGTTWFDIPTNGAVLSAIAQTANGDILSEYTDWARRRLYLNIAFNESLTANPGSANLDIVIPKDHETKTDELTITDINGNSRDVGKVILYRGSAITGTTMNGKESGIYELCVSADGKVVAVGVASCEIPLGGYVISAKGDPASILKKYQVGSTVKLSTSIASAAAGTKATLSYESDISIPPKTDFGWNLTEGKAYGGKLDIYAKSQTSNENLSIKVDGINITTQSKSEMRVLYETPTDNDDRIVKTDTANASNMISLNGNQLGKFPSNGTLGYGIDSADFIDGDNKVTVIIGGTWGGATYDENKPHGIQNQGDKDDFLLKDFRMKMPDGSVASPVSMTTYKTKEVGSTEKVITANVPFASDQWYWLGDGWGANDTWAGNTTGGFISGTGYRYDIPYKIDFVFAYHKPAKETTVSLNTTEITNGEHTIELYLGSECVAKSKIMIDNKGPEISTNIKAGQTLSAGAVIDAAFDDTGSGLDKISASLEGKVISLPYTVPSTLKKGIHSLIITATDNASNTNLKELDFIFDDSTLADYSISGTSASPVLKVNTAIPGSISYRLVNSNLLNYSATYGVTDGSKKPASEKTYDDWYVYNMMTGKQATKSSSVSGLPYQAFDIDVTGRSTSDYVQVSFDGSTIKGERFCLKAYNNTTSEWDKLGTATGSGTISAKLQISKYAESNKIRVIATPDYEGNGSNTMLWMTDPQHYTKFNDLNEYYYQMTQYAADEYKAGKAAYLMNTGDLVDDSPAMSGAASQWLVFDKAHKILDDAGVPYGLVSGNHDVGSNPSALDYKYIEQYVGADRFRNKNWYGGNLDNNKSHYDLVTIGNVDFVMVYIAYGLEDTPQTISWANEVLKNYSHRNAIILTHQYLSTSGKHEGRGQSVYDNIVVPNENVKIVLCGHNDGAATVKQQIGNRVVYEILSDYQFTEIYDNGFNHTIGTVAGCNGDGYMRSMSIDGNRVSTKTFSPVTGGNNVYGVHDEFDINVDFGTAARSITTNHFSAAILGSDASTNVSIQPNENIDLNISSIVSDAWCAAITDSVGNTTVTATNAKMIGAEPTVPSDELVSVDLYNLISLIDQSKQINPSLYTNITVNALNSAISAAQNIVDKSNPTQQEISAAYTALVVANGGLIKKQSYINPASLTSIHNYTTDPSKWKSQASSGYVDFSTSNAWVSQTAGANNSMIINQLPHQLVIRQFNLMLHTLLHQSMVKYI